MDEKTQKLEVALKRLEKPGISNEASQRMKKNILLQMRESSQLSSSSVALKNKIQNLSNKVVISPILKLRIKERVFSVIGSESSKRVFARNFAGMFQKTVAAFVVFAVILTSVMVYIEDIPVTMAARSTYIQEIKGTVKVLRDYELKKAYEGMMLQENDIIITGANGIAFIRYLDDSVTRLSPLAELKINRLQLDSENKAHTYVELELVYGRVWSQVVNLLHAESSFVMLTGGITASSNKRASFDVENNVNDGGVRIKVFNNKVEVDLRSDEKEQKRYLSEGYQMEIDRKDTEFKKITVSRGDSDHESWIRINKAKDLEYREKLEAERALVKRESAGVLPRDPMYTVKKFNETAKLRITGDERAKIKLKVDIAKRRLTEAHALYSEGDFEEAEKILEEFISIYDEIKFDAMHDEDLKAYIDDAISFHSKELAFVLPDSDVYPVKQSLREARNILALTNLDRKNVALESAAEKIQEAKDLVLQEKFDIAVDTVIRANRDMGRAAYHENDNTTVSMHIETLSGLKLLEESLSDSIDSPAELHRLVSATKEILADNLQQTVGDPYVEICEDVREKAGDALKEALIYPEVTYIDTRPPEIFDEAVVMPALQEEQVSIRSLRK